MKNSIISASFLGLLLLSISSFATDKKVKEEKSKTSNANFDLSFYQLKNTQKVKLAVEKGTSFPVSIELVDNKGNLFYDEKLPRNESLYSRIFDLSELNPGTYSLEISSNGQKIRKQIDIKSNMDRTISLQ